MALFKSSLLTSGSGSIGGQTLSHNRSGLYIRARRVPTNPRTSFQNAVRGNLTAAVAAWMALDAPSQAAWATYAATVPRKNRLGDTIFLTAQQMYVATASLSALLSFTLSSAPASAGASTLGDSLTIAASIGPDTITIGGLTGSLFKEAGAKIGVFVGDGISTSRTFYKAPYQLLGVITGATGTATTATITPATYRGGTTLQGTLQLPVRLAGIDSTGRLSNTLEVRTLPA